MLEKTPESPLDSKDIKPGNPKGNQPSILIGRTGAEAEALILGPTDRSSIQSTKTRPGADCGSHHELLITKFRLKLKKVGKKKLGGL